MSDSFYRKNQRVLLPFLILLAAAVIFAVLIVLKPEPQQKDDVNKAPLVSVESLVLEAKQFSVRSQGVFKSRYETALVAQVAGELLSMSPKFERGGIVKKGELLAQIDPFNYEVQLEDAKAQLAAAQAALILEEAQASVAKAEWEKIHDTAPTALSLRKPQLAQAKARVSAAQAGVKQAAKNVERTRIVAPFDALISERKVSLGTFVAAGSALGLVLDVGYGEVRLPVPSNDLAYLEGQGFGAPVELSAEVGGESETWKAEIIRSEGLIDESSRMVYLVARIQDPYSLHSGAKVLPFGAYVIASIQGRALSKVAIVPRQVIDNSMLPLYEDGKLALRKVDVVRVEGANAIVTGVLQNGERLIVSTLQNPVEGMPLEILE